MAKWSFGVGTFTPTATGDTTGFGAGTYMAIGAGSATQMINVMEIYEAGLNSASAINQMTFARDSTLAVTPTALSSPNTNGPLNPNTAALAAAQTAFVAASTEPQRSSSIAAARLNLSFNSFGGIVRWVAAPGEEWMIYGTALGPPPSGESSLSSPAGSAGAMSAHIIYEPF
jgi:hypothetical protein